MQESNPQRPHGCVSQKLQCQRHGCSVYLTTAPRGSFACRSCDHKHDKLHPLNKVIQSPTLNKAPLSLGETYIIHRHLTCQTENVVYLLTCTLCQSQYVGETCRTLEDIIVEKCADIRHKRNTPFAGHFRQPGHSAENISVMCIDKPPKSDTTMTKTLKKDWTYQASNITTIWH